jgi:para-nitrobenzyl esterase
VFRRCQSRGLILANESRPPLLSKRFDMLSAPKSARIPLLVFAVLMLVAPPVRAGTSYEAKVTGGVIAGRPDGPGAIFAGVPFAQPPVGNLRWKAPQDVIPWEGVRPAMEPGPDAIQPDAGWNHAMVLNSSEDCLYLNVIAPYWPATRRLPVVVFIHGGGNFAGGGWEHLISGSTLQLRGVVLVTITYRLGIFGFFAHPGLSRESPQHASGNYAILDQIAALRWVRANIALFGGDPGNVTLVGQSAGSYDISLLMVSPLARGLFSKAIEESGIGVGLPSTNTQAQEEAAGSALGADIAQLRAMSPAALLSTRKVWSMCFPNVDGWVFTEAPAATFAAGREAGVPLLLGTNARESSFPGTLGDLHDAIAKQFGDGAGAALKLYGLDGIDAMPPADPVLGDIGAQFMTDITFRGPTAIFAEWHHSHGGAVWLYEFSRTPIGHESSGASHSSELPYVFGEMTPNPLGSDYNASDRRISSEMQGYWVNFATSGNPNGDGLPSWQPYEASDGPYVEFTEGGTRMGRDLRQPYSKFYGDWLKSQMAH